VRRLEDVGEHEWIARLTRRLSGAGKHARVLVGPGDDAAVIAAGRRPLLLTTDTLREGVHFRTRWLTPRALGRRAFAVNASDLAAMGGLPTFALLALEAPPATPVPHLDALVSGFASAARETGARLVGGNLVRGSALALTAALIGEAPGRVVTRAGARPGDGLWVTGQLGAAGVAIRALTRGRQARLSEPPRRLRAGSVLAGLASAMIDVSDGLLQDLGHLCRASNVAADLEIEHLPVAPRCQRALGPAAAAFAAIAGEDYELLFALPPRREQALARVRARLGCRLTRIGRVRRGRPRVRVLDGAGRPLALGRRGFDHFR
jgi:thiamine-monophosphate kinase